MRGHFILKILSCPQHILALLSFGAMRKSVFHHDETREKRKILLLLGQPIVMPSASCHCQHAMIKSSRIMEERGSLMFRTHE